MYGTVTLEARHLVRTGLVLTVVGLPADGDPQSHLWALARICPNPVDPGQGSLRPGAQFGEIREL